MPSIELDPKKTALVLIDLQNGVVGRDTAPYPAVDVVAKGKQLADAFRAKGSPVVYVRVDINDFLKLPVDDAHLSPTEPLPAFLSEIVESAGKQPEDLLVTKRHWGAFAGTGLEHELRAFGVDTVVLTGIATNFGVESTARQGTGLGFAFVIVEDACTSLNADAHVFAFQTIFPRLARVRSTTEVLEALA